MVANPPLDGRAAPGPTGSARLGWLSARPSAWPPAPLVLAGLAIAALCALPPGYLLWRAAQEPQAAWSTLADPSAAQLAARTLAYAAVATAIAAAIALPMAWLTTRSDLPGRRLVTVLSALPLAIPSYVAALVAVSALGPRGLLQQALGPLGVDRLPSIYGFWGAAFVVALVSYPLMLLTLRPAIARLDPRLEELSRSFGYGRWTTLRRVVLPQLRPALLSGGLLVALYALADFGAVSLMRFDSLTRAVFVRYTAGFDRAGASTLALLLVVLALAVVALEVSTRGARRHHATRGGAGRPPRVPLGRWRWPALGFVAAVLGPALALPAGVLGYWLVRGLAAGEAMRGLGDAVADTLIAGALAALVTVAAALPIALLATRYRRFPLTRPIEVLSYAGYALPGLAVALAFAVVAVRMGPLYQSLVLLIVAYALLFLPQAVGTTRVALITVRPAMEEAARGLGRRPWRAFSEVTLPLAGRGVAAGAALVFLTTVKELPATLLLAPIGFETLAVRVWSSSSEAFFARAALPALLLIALSVLPLAATGLWRRDA
jgi:iron(III) transport system permease protein